MRYIIPIVFVAATVLAGCRHSAPMVHTQTPARTVAAPPPTRSVQANTLTSERDPSVRIELPKQVRYVGADRWILYGVADCELHVFVEADERKHVKRLYWIQFEGYLPTRPELRYNPSPSETLTIAGMDFFIRTRFGPTADTPRAGSDTEHVQVLLQSNGYTLPPEMMNARFIHYLDEPKRQELMLIYSEDLSSTGFTASQLVSGGVAQPQWAAISESLVQRANKNISVKKIPRP